jgi:hypothetical protein
LANLEWRQPGPQTWGISIVGIGAFDATDNVCSPCLSGIILGGTVTKEKDRWDGTKKGRRNKNGRQPSENTAFLQLDAPGFFNNYTLPLWQPLELLKIPAI